MKRTMLKDENAAIDTDDFTVGKGFLKLHQCKGVFLGVVVGGNKNRTIDDEEVCMRGWKSQPFFNITRVGEGKWVKCVGLSVWRAESEQFLLHCLQFLIMLVCGIIAFHVGDGSGRTESCYRVNVSVGVVACQP